MKIIYDSGRNYEGQCWVPDEIHDFNDNSPEISCKVCWDSNWNSVLLVGVLRPWKQFWDFYGWEFLNFARISANRVGTLRILIWNLGFRWKLWVFSKKSGIYRNLQKPCRFYGRFYKFLVRMLDFNGRSEISARVLGI